MERTTLWLSGGMATFATRREGGRQWNRRQLRWEFEVEGRKVDGEKKLETKGNAQKRKDQETNESGRDDGSGSHPHLQVYVL